MHLNSEQKSFAKFRLAIVLLVAISVSLPMAWVSLAKLLLFVCGLGFLIAAQFQTSRHSNLRGMWTPSVILLIVLVFALSLLWTEVDAEFALKTFIKHSKLLGIVLLIVLIRSEREARAAITAFAAAQVFVLISSWLLAANVSLPWVFNAQDVAASRYVVFAESYLDQSIMMACTAAVVWHLSFDGHWPRWVAGVVAIGALLNIFILLPGRTGYIVAFALLGLAGLWTLNHRIKIVLLVVTPLLVAFGVYFSSGQLHERVYEVVHETQRYSAQAETQTSSGWRLNAWQKSIQAIVERPWYGYGVGSWTPTVKRLQGATATQVFGASDSSNPHQEYLLWGVEVGVLGVVLLVVFLLAVARDARGFPTGTRRAALSIVVAIGIACCFNSSLFDDLMGDFLCITLGLMLALGVNQGGSRNLHRDR
jgi:O-antigen ligase